MTRQRPPTASFFLLCLLPLLFFYIMGAAAIPSGQIQQPQQSQNRRQAVMDEDVSMDDDDEYEDDDEEYDEEYDEELETIMQREEEQRKLELPSDVDPYTIIENSPSCFWCGTSVPENDTEHRKATIFTYSIYIEPGTCVTNESPLRPAKYPNDVDHRWTYTTDALSVMTFSVAVGGLQISRGCHRDKLVVRVGNQITKKCGQFYNFNIDSSDTATMYVRFATNHRIRWHGYTGTICASTIPTTTTTPPPSTTTTTPQSTTTTAATEPIYCDDICGDANGYTAGRISLVNDADMTYPWVITLDVMRDELFVRCSGYLISRKHIITSAFCFFQETPTGVDDVMIRVMAGEYDISTSETPAAQILYATNVTLYDLFDSNNGGGVYNMALVTMPGNGFTLNSRVAPICMANSTVESDLAGTGSTLYLSGFGWTENDYPAINMTTANLLTCPFAWSDTDLLCIYIFGQPSTPCHGDAGGAIYKQWTDSKYYAVGHVNAITVDDCPLNGFVFPCPATAFYLEWINNATGPRYCNND